MPGSTSPGLRSSLQSGIRHHKEGRIEQARAIYQSILDALPDQFEALYLLAVVAQQTDHPAQAVELLSRAEQSRPNQAAVHLQLGLAFSQMDDTERAIASYRKALHLDSRCVEAACNLGNQLKRSGDRDGALQCYGRALQLAPSMPEIPYNVGVLYQECLQPDKAIDWFRKAIALRPDYAAAYNHLGVALSEIGCLEDAARHYRHAQSLDPGSADAFYNLHALLLRPPDWREARACLESALTIEPGNDVYRFSLGVLLEVMGDPGAAASCFAAAADSDQMRADLQAWDYLKSLGDPLPTLCGSSLQTFALALEQARVSGLVLEFGVYQGRSIRQLAGLVEGAIHGFDSFEGIPDDWCHEQRGSYSTQGALPEVPAHVSLHRGWFEDSIPRFLSTESGPIRFINIDCDLFSSTKTVLDLLAQQIVPGTVIVFDEFIGYPGWQEHEFRAFNEAAERLAWRSKVLAFSFVTRQVVIRITAT